MLIEFTVKNYRSIKDEQTLSLVKAKGDELERSNSFEPDAPGGVQLLRSAVLYGANAAGKSNVISAMSAMDTIVRNSASSSQEGDNISVTPFIFDGHTANEPTKFEMIFISEGTKYQFGFLATTHHVLEEWLIAYPKGRAQRWYSRVYDRETKNSVYKFSDFLSGQKSIWQSATRTNALFLSTAIQLNSEQLKPIFNWFKKKLRPIAMGGLGPSFTASLCGATPKKSRVIEFLKSADLNIHDIQIEREKFNPEYLPEDLPAMARENIIQEMKDKDIIDIKSIHKIGDGTEVSLDLDEESDGTQKFFSFAGPWLDTLDNGYILVIDELHDSLHPILVRYLVNLFHDNKTNPNNAQLIFTTHDTSILSQEVFRRDQIWFCEKNESQATYLYPLTDFSPRKDRENIASGYLSGRYGSLPFISHYGS